MRCRIDTATNDMIQCNEEADYIDEQDTPFCAAHAYQAEQGRELAGKLVGLPDRSYFRPIDQPEPIVTLTMRYIEYTLLLDLVNMAVSIGNHNTEDIKRLIPEINRTMHLFNVDRWTKFVVHIKKLSAAYPHVQVKLGYNLTDHEEPEPF